MPQPIPFTEDDIVEMSRMRWAGASLREIAAYFETSASTVLSYVRGIHPQPEGQVLEYVPLDNIYKWRSVLPIEGLPLPRWFTTWMEERLRPRMQFSLGGSYSTENEDDDRHRRR